MGVNDIQNLFKISITTGIKTHKKYFCYFYKAILHSIFLEDERGKILL